MLLQLSWVVWSFLSAANMISTVTQLTVNHETTKTQPISGDQTILSDTEEPILMSEDKIMFTKNINPDFEVELNCSYDFVIEPVWAKSVSIRRLKEKNTPHESIFDMSPGGDTKLEGCHMGISERCRVQTSKDSNLRKKCWILVTFEHLSTTDIFQCSVEISQKADDLDTNSPLSIVNIVKEVSADMCNGKQFKKVSDDPLVQGHLADCPSLIDQSDCDLECCQQLTCGAQGDTFNWFNGSCQVKWCPNPTNIDKVTTGTEVTEVQVYQIQSDTCATYQQYYESSDGFECNCPLLVEYEDCDLECCIRNSCHEDYRNNTNVIQIKTMVHNEGKVIEVCQLVSCHDLTQIVRSSHYYDKSDLHLNLSHGIYSGVSDTGVESEKILVRHKRQNHNYMHPRPRNFLPGTRWTRQDEWLSMRKKRGEIPEEFFKNERKVRHFAHKVHARKSRSVNEEEVKYNIKIAKDGSVSAKELQKDVMSLPGMDIFIRKNWRDSVMPNPRIILFEKGNFSGRTRVFVQSVPNLNSFTWTTGVEPKHDCHSIAKEVKSILVEGSNHFWEVHGFSKEKNYVNIVLTPGAYNLNRLISLGLHHGVVFSFQLHEKSTDATAECKEDHEGIFPYCIPKDATEAGIQASLILDDYLLYGGRIVLLAGFVILLASVHIVFFFYIGLSRKRQRKKYYKKKISTRK